MTIRSVSCTPALYQKTPLYTVPAGKRAFVRKIFAAQDVHYALHQIRVSIFLPNDVNIVNDTLVVVSSKTASLLDETIPLEAGDTITASLNWQLCTRPIAGQRLPNNIDAFLVNTANNAWVVSCGVGYGLWRSTDQGITWTKVYTTKSVVASYVYFNNTFFFYMTDGTTLKSVDNGITFTLENYSNTPRFTDCLGNKTGRILVKNGTLLVAVGTTKTRLVSSTDGITWTNLGVALPSSNQIATLDWTGTKYIVGAFASVGAYYSGDATAWTVSGNTVSNFITILGCDVSRGFVYAHNGSMFFVSNDYGVNFTNTNNSIGDTIGNYIWTGSYLFGGYTSANAIVKSVTYNTHNSPAIGYGHYFNATGGAYVLSDRIVGVMGNYIWETYNNDPIANPRYGAVVHCTVIEENV